MISKIHERCCCGQCARSTIYGNVSYTISDVCEKKIHWVNETHGEEEIDVDPLDAKRDSSVRYKINIFSFSLILMAPPCRSTGALMPILFNTL